MNFTQSGCHEFYMVNWLSDTPNASLWDANCGRQRYADYSVWRLLSQSVSAFRRYGRLVASAWNSQTLVTVIAPFCHCYQCCICHYHICLLYLLVKCYNIYCSLQKALEVIISEMQIICKLFWKLLWKCMMTPFVPPCMLRHQCRQRKRDIAARVTAVITTGMKPWQPRFGPNNHYCLLLRPPPHSHLYPILVKRLCASFLLSNY